MNQNALATVDQGSELAAPGQETSTAGQSALARAQVEARYLVALRRPRNLDQVRTDILRDCKRTAFAEKALYRLPFYKNDDGSAVTGLSIRFAEAALAYMGNNEARATVVYEDEAHVILNCSVTDLERNTSYSVDVDVPKTTEKRTIKDGDRPVGQRLNSKGQVVYLVPANSMDMAKRKAAEVSKAVRTNGLRLVPAWIKEEAVETIRATLESDAASDPDAARRRLVDAFVAVGVQPRDLSTYLGHDLSGASPAELADLRTVYTAVKDGVATWHDILAAKTGVESDGEEDGNAELREKLAGVRQKLDESKKRKVAKGAPSQPGERVNPDTGEVSDAPRQREPGED